jgi:hypothetical protein
VRGRWAKSAAAFSALLVATSCGGAGRTLAGSTSPSRSSLECELPALPAPGTGNPTLGGPAVASLQGGAVRAEFELDGGQLSVAPPHPGDNPSVSADQAECAGLAALNANGLPLVQYAKLFGGAVVGYGRVSVAQQLVDTAQPPGYLQGTDNERSQPTLPPAAAYRQHLAWLVVVKNGGYWGGCGPTPPTTTEAPTPSDDYIVFLLDAHTGADALLYIESPGPCDTGQLPAMVAVPADLLSVPWTLRSRASDNSLAQISATVLPCDGYPYSVSPDRTRTAVSVVVERPVDPSCGSYRQVSVKLQSDSPLPARIMHDPLGPYVTWPPP